MPKQEQEYLNQLIALLGGHVSDTATVSDRRRHWRGLINQTPTADVPEAYFLLEDDYLSRHHRQVYDLSDCQATQHPRLFLFKGDMTGLALDVLVNAANSDLLGCFIPNHKCLDNAIHTFAGARLRQACHRLTAEQGHREPVGHVKQTSAYHLPARAIYHTVGPFVPAGKPVSAIRQSLLRQAYLACLTKAEQDGVTSLAFPCLSTGEFGFPRDLACQIAVKTVTDFLATNQTGLVVVFVLYTKEDQELYEQLLLKTNNQVQEKRR